MSNPFKKSPPRLKISSPSAPTTPKVEEPSGSQDPNDPNHPDYKPDVWTSYFGMTANMIPVEVTFHYKNSRERHPPGVTNMSGWKVVDMRTLEMFITLMREKTENYAALVENYDMLPPSCFSEMWVQPNSRQPDEWTTYASDEIMDLHANNKDIWDAELAKGRVVIGRAKLKFVVKENPKIDKIIWYPPKYI